MRVVCSALLEDADEPSAEQASLLQNSVSDSQVVGVLNSICYLRERVGVPRDLPLASARYLRAYLNWGVDVLSKR